MMTPCHTNQILMRVSFIMIIIFVFVHKLTAQQTYNILDFGAIADGH